MEVRLQATLRDSFPTGGVSEVSRVESDSRRPAPVSAQPFNSRAAVAYFGRIHGAPVAQVRVTPLGGIFGVDDSYPLDGSEALGAIEQRAVAFRWRLRPRTGRCARCTTTLGRAGDYLS